MTNTSSSHRDDILELYIAYFNRAPERDGVNYWTGELDRRIATGQTREAALKIIADAFYGAALDYGVFRPSDPTEQFIRTVYRNMFGRDEVDAAGLAYWSALLDSGQVSRGDFVLDVLHSAKAYIAAAGPADPFRWLGPYLENRLEVGRLSSDLTWSMTGAAAIDFGIEVMRRVVSPETAKAGQSTAEAATFAGIAIRSWLDERALATSKTIAAFDANSLLPASDLIVRSLDSGSSWAQKDVTWGFPETIPAWQSGLSVQGASFPADWRPFAQSGRAATADIMRHADSLIKLDLREVAGATPPDIAIFMAERLSMAGYGYWPSEHPTGGDIAISTKYGSPSDWQRGSYGYLVLIHELGHALGLKHPFESGAILPKPDDHRVHSVMSYTNFRELVPVFTTSGNTINLRYDQVFPETFMVYDIAALHAIYGPDPKTNTGDNVYVIPNRPFYMTLYDAGGIDTLDFSNSSGNNIIDLRPGQYSHVGFRPLEELILHHQMQIRETVGSSVYDAWIAQALSQVQDRLYTGENALGIAFGTVIENATGSRFNDTFIGNHVDNLLLGGPGDDLFILGQGGRDVVDGGPGQDVIRLPIRAATASYGVMDGASGREGFVFADGFSIRFVGVERVEFQDLVWTL